jgi:2-polyprenyl-3-methyl-5-hydroxy-6-metoxy-1,4-benzoquinol methylase
MAAYGETRSAAAPRSGLEMNLVAGICPVCASAKLEAIYDLAAAEFTDAVPGLVVRCTSCFMWFKLLNDPAGIPKAYTGEYGDDETAQTYLLGTAARNLFRDALTNVKGRLQSTRPRLLDLGAGPGALVEEALRMGFEAEGVDHCEANVDVACAKGLRVRLGAAEDLDDQATFDVVTMMDIIEHVPEPLRLLTAAQRALKPGGELVVYTPNHRATVVMLAKLLYRLGVRYPVEELFGRNHVCFFDDRSLPMALNRAGFEVRRVEQFPYDPARPGQEISPLNLAVVSFVERLGRPFDRGFRMLAYAQRP